MDSNRTHRRGRDSASAFAKASAEKPRAPAASHPRGVACGPARVRTPPWDVERKEKAPSDSKGWIQTGPTGEGGIRTRGTGLIPYNGLANRRLQPLGHLSRIAGRRHRTGRTGVTLRPRQGPVKPSGVKTRLASPATRPQGVCLRTFKSGDPSRAVRQPLQSTRPAFLAAPGEYEKASQKAHTSGTDHT